MRKNRVPNLKKLCKEYPSLEDNLKSAFKDLMRDAWKLKEECSHTCCSDCILDNAEYGCIICGEKYQNPPRNWHLPFEFEGEKLYGEEVPKIPENIMLTAIRKSKIDIRPYLEDRAVNALEKANVKTVGDIFLRTPAEIKKLRGIGDKTYEQIKDVLYNELGKELVDSWLAS